MTEPLSGSNGRAALGRLAAATRPILFLDVDGTLAPLVRLPENARTPWRTRSLLQQLRRSGAKVVLVSGRAARDAYRVVGHELDGILGNHGAELLKARRLRRWIVSNSARIDAAAEAVADQLAPWPGVRLESKGHSVSLHHRLSLLDRRQLMGIVRRALRGGEIVAMPGRQVIDIRARGVDKGTAVLRWLEREEQGKVPLSDVVYAGDDTTDQDAFRALGPRAVTIAVGRRPRGARFRTSTPVTLVQWLERLRQARR